MKKFIIVAAVLFLSACHIQQSPKSPTFGNAKVYTTPGGKGGVSHSKYEVTPL